MSLMCTDGAGPAASGPTIGSGLSLEARPQLTIPLEPVDSVVVTTLMDNVTDTFMPEQGPARRAGPGRCTRAAGVMEDGTAPDALIAEHGFSAL